MLYGSKAPILRPSLQHKQPAEHKCTGLLASVKTTSVCLSTPLLRHCTFQDCQNQELVSVTCPFCIQEFCLKHRHQQEHDCIKLNKPDSNPSKTAALVKSILDAKSDVQKKNVRTPNKGSAKLSAQVNLMKIKMNALGEKSIPQDNRVFFTVVLPNANMTKNYFFCKLWTIGKLVDYVSAIENLTNLNNIATAKKLKLFNDANESYVMDETLNELLQNKTILNGQSVILKYET